MTDGKWYLRYEYDRVFDREFGSGPVPVTEAKVVLTAKNEGDALTEGKRKWKEILAETREEPNKRNGESNHRDPRIVCEISI